MCLTGSSSLHFSNFLEVKMHCLISVISILVIISFSHISVISAYNSRDPIFHSSDELDHHDHLPTQGICEPIKIGICMEVGYNETTMPNLVGHDAQADAEALLQTFTPLIQYGCSAHLKLFLCSAYVPMCTEKVPQPIGPCRSLCESVRRSCEPILTEFGFSWPPSLNCSKFHPENNHQHMCIPGPNDYERNTFGTTTGGGGRHTDSHFSHPSFTSSSPTSMHNNNNNNPRDKLTQIGRTRDRKPIHVQNNNQDHLDLPFPFSQHHFTNDKVNTILKQHQSNQNSPPIITTETKKAVHTDSTIFNINNHNNNNVKLQHHCFGPRKIWTKGACWIKCPSTNVDDAALLRMKNNEMANSITSGASTSFVADEQNGNNGFPSLFLPSERSFARNYILLWASLSLSAALIALTLSVCSPKLNTAERPILYIALCQVLFSIGIIIGSTIPFACFIDPGTETELLAGSGMVPSSCAVVFLLTYFFGTAATLWWVILCLSWLLSVNRKLACSLEQKEWSIFHLASWGISSLLTSAALIHKKVDVDELTGLCGVGFQNTEALTYYNMIPLNICLSKGFLFLLIGIILRHFTSRNSQLLNSFGLEKLNATNNQLSNEIGPTCELRNHPHHIHRQSSRRGRQQGYSPVLVLPNNSHSSSCSSHGHCLCNNSNNVNSNSTVTNGLQLQRIKALQNSKSVWLRVGIFALVHSIPIACQVGTMAYELSGREAWENGRERPNIQIFLLRLNMNLIAGLTTGVWVLSTYSWKSLSAMSRRLCSCSCACLKLFSIAKQKNVNGHKQAIDADVGVGSSVLSNHNLATPPTSAPLIPVTSSTGGLLQPAPPPPSMQSMLHNPVLSTFQNTNYSNNNNNNHAPYSIRTNNHAKNFSGIVPRHHINHPLPPIPPARNNVSLEPQRTDAWRRGETIL